MTAAAPPNEQPVHALKLAAIVWSPLVLLHLFLMVYRPFHYDEYKTIWNVNHGLLDLIKDRLTAGHQPLYFVTAWLWAQVSGDSVFAIRLLPQLAGFGAMWFLYQLIRREAGARTGVLAVAICMLSFAFMQICHVGRPYTFTLFFALAVTHVIMNALSGASMRQCVIIAVLTLLLLLTHGSAYPIVGALIIFLGFRLIFKGEGGAALISVLIALAAFLPWLLYTLTWIDRKSRFGWLNPGQWMDMPAAIFGFSFSVDLLDWGTGDSWPKRIIAWSLWTAVIITIAFGLSRYRHRIVFTLFWAVPIAIAAYTLFGLDLNTFNTARYFSVTVAVQAGAIAIAATWQGWPPTVRRLLWILPVMLSLVGLGRIMVKTERDPYDMDVVQYIKQRAKDADMIYVLQNSRLRYQLEIYTDHDVYMMHQVYGIPSSYVNTTLGVPEVKPGQAAVDPLPHEDTDEILIIAGKTELEMPSEDNVYGIPQELRNHLDEIKSRYTEINETQTYRCVILHLRKKSTEESPR